MQHHLQNQSHMRSMGHHSPPPRLLSIHSSQTHPMQQTPPTSLPNIHPSQQHHLHLLSQQQQQQSPPLPPSQSQQQSSHSQSSVPSDRISMQKMQSPHPGMTQSNQTNGHYNGHPSHSHQQQNGETRPSVIESNQPLIIECT